MRKLVFALALLGLVSSLGAPAQANHPLGAWHNATWTASVPCHFACPYWTDDANQDLDGDGAEDVFFQACSNPDGTADALAAAPGVPHEGNTYDDITVGPAPDGTRLLEVELTPQIDFDGFICARNANGTAGEELAITANTLPGTCDNIVGNDSPLPINCIERGSIEAIAGRRYIIRVYNWSDGPSTAGRYRFRGTS